MVAAAIVGTSVVGGLVSADAQRSAGNKAADAQREAAQQGIGEQRHQFDAIQKLLSPWVTAGTGALQQQQNLLGLSGQDAQRQALQQTTEQSPWFNQLAKQGENAILQNASATGGLRGGNVQAALAQFRPGMLNQLFQQQLANLGGLSTQGQNAANMTSQAGQNEAGAVTNLLAQQGAAQAGGALNAGRAQIGAYNALGQGLGLYGGLGGFGGLGRNTGAGIISGGSGINFGGQP